MNKSIIVSNNRVIDYEIVVTDTRLNSFKLQIACCNQLWWGYKRLKQSFCLWINFSNLKTFLHTNHDDVWCNIDIKCTKMQQPIQMPLKGVRHVKAKTSSKLLQVFPWALNFSLRLFIMLLMLLPLSLTISLFLALMMPNINMTSNAFGES